MEAGPEARDSVRGNTLHAPLVLLVLQRNTQLQVRTRFGLLASERAGTAAARHAPLVTQPHAMHLRITHHGVELALNIRLGQVLIHAVPIDIVVVDRQVIVHLTLLPERTLNFLDDEHRVIEVASATGLNLDGLLKHYDVLKEY